jgi:hypothetical protein
LATWLEIFLNLVCMELWGQILITIWTQV